MTCSTGPETRAASGAEKLMSIRVAARLPSELSGPPTSRTSYGATAAGGAANSGWGYGTVYELTLQSKTVQATVE